MSKNMSHFAPTAIADIAVWLRQRAEGHAPDHDIAVYATPEIWSSIADHLYPTEMSPELREVLGTICFQCIPFVQAFRAAGIEIPTKAEAEQAYVLHWMTGLVLKHGAGWRAAAIAEMNALRIAALKASVAEPATPITQEAGQ